MRFEFGDCQLDTDRYEIRRGDVVQPVEPQVFDVLALLLREHGRVVSKEQILDTVWGNRFVSESALTSRIKAARRAIGDDGRGQRLIRTVHGRGYEFVGEVVVADTASAAAVPPLRFRLDAAELLERDVPLAALGHAYDAAAAGHGCVVLVSGEPGIGKTALVARFAAGLSEGRVLWGACDDLLTPRPLGPFRDIAGGLAAALGQLLAAGATPPEIHGRLLAELSTQPGPTVLVIEDVHWADDATLDAVTFVGRRIAALPAMLVLTFRAGDVAADFPLHAALAAVRATTTQYVQLEPLSRSAVATLAGERADEVYTATGGSPFYVTELLAAEPGTLPPSIVHAVLGRAARLGDDSRHLVELVSMVPTRTATGLLDTVQPNWTRLAEEPERRQLLQVAADHVRFRHELSRHAIRSSVPTARRRRLHAEILEGLLKIGADPAEIVHHAEAAGALEVAADHALVAARRAAAVGSHREAYSQFMRAARFADRLSRPDRAAMFAERAIEAAATDHNAQAAEDFSRARVLLLDVGDVIGAAALVPGLVAVRHLLGDPLPDRIFLLRRGIDELAGEDGDDALQARAELLAATAAAYLVDDRLDEAVDASRQALAAARGADERIRINTTATLGSVLVFAGRMDEGWARLEESIRQAAEHSLEAEAARGYRMIGSSASALVEYERAERWLGEGIDYATRTEQWNHRHYMAAHQAHVWWCQGRWDEADRAVQEVLGDGQGGITTRITAMHVSGFLALGRGQFESAVRWLGEARAAGEEMGELQRYSPALWGLAEVATLRHDWAEAVTLTDAGYAASHHVADAANLFPYLVTGTRARLGQHDVAAAQEWADAVSTDLLAREIPGTLPTIDHATGLIQLAAGRTGKARERLEAAYAAWSGRRRWWDAQWCALDLARCAIASNRRTEASALVATVLAAAATAAAQPLLEAATEIDSRLDRHDAVQPWSPLTLRELEVARLVARGLTNREIAAELRITARTAGSHLEHIRTKLGAGRRSEIAAWVTALDAQRRR
jgi:DNA-binding winged helix-turn-helix (wHTH) protein/DNA-binding CsgD family transcriptional regulator/tetratricopeptide (TPR) repeat protein